jgi:hypothetical protein
VVTDAAPNCGTSRRTTPTASAWFSNAAERLTDLGRAGRRKDPHPLGTMHLLGIDAIPALRGKQRLDVA